MTLDPVRLAAVLDAHAPARPVPLCPDIAAWSCVDELPLWTALEDAVGARVGAPFFGLVWPGAQLLAASIRDGMIPVAGLRVADVGCGSGVAAVAAARAGAREVLAVDVDPLACAAASILASRHGVSVRPVVGDPLVDEALLDDVDVVLCGDLVYSKDVAAAAARAVARWRARGARVVLADSGRPFFDPQGLPLLVKREVDVPKVVDGVARRVVRLYAS